MKTKIVFKMRIAVKLMQMGHKVDSVLPNPISPGYKMWAFVVDDTLDEDLKKVVEDYKNGR